MLVVVSPAKNLDFESDIPVKQFTQPVMLEDTEKLMEVCRTLSPADLSSLMKISDKLATLNANRFAEFTTPFGNKAVIHETVHRKSFCTKYLIGQAIRACFLLKAR